MPGNKRTEIEIAYRNGRVVAIREGAPEPQSLGPLALGGGFKVRSLSESLGVSERQLHRLFSDSLGISPKDWLRRERMVQARQLLLEGLQVQQAAAALGFRSIKDFSREFQAVCDVSPTDFQRRQDAEVQRRLE